jgi:tripartite-type tricarboxylate transporter receptor subunit TctC
LRALAVTSPERSSAMPDVPTMAESGLPGFQAVSWHGIVAPAGTPDAVVATLNQALTGALASPEVKQRLLEEGARASSVNTAEFGKFIQTEIAAWAKAVKDSGATTN